MFPDSIVIVKWPKGYTATLKYEDKFKCKTYSTNNHQKIHAMVDRHVRENM